MEGKFNLIGIYDLRFMSVREFDKLKPRDFTNGAVLDEIRNSLRIVENQSNKIEIMSEKLRRVLDIIQSPSTPPEADYLIRKIYKAIA